MTHFCPWILLVVLLSTSPLSWAETVPEVVKPEGIVEDPVGPAFITTTSEQDDSTSKAETATKKDAESGAALKPLNHAHAQEGCLGICKKYQEICSADSIYNEKDCREQWNACETGCLQL